MNNKISAKDIGIYEPIYLDGQTISQKNFIPYEHKRNSEFSHWREFRIHVDMFRNRTFEKHAFTGLFSPKFELKTKITGPNFANFCAKNDDADVIFINPFPHLVYMSFNIWMQAESNHTGIVEVASNLLKDAGVNLSINTEERHGHTVLGYSSFWCGNAKFWHAYVGGVLNPLAEFIENNPNAASVKAALQETFHTDPSPYLPFITERLFTTFIAQQKDIKSRHYPLNPIDYCFNQDEIDLVSNTREFIDAADENQTHTESAKQNMQDICNQAIIDAKKYFKNNIHPHTGRVIN